ncbi:MAG: hypothetical protein AB7U46_03385 [Paenirhodobacter sp.]|uniref:hypothetical protein n=1 Tax=Paenirhodobacter sp. TaxID=1965326 RepID=UPI003D0EB080
MHKSFSLPLLSSGAAILGSALLTLRAEAAPSPSDALFALPLALWHFLQGALVFFVLPALVIGALAHRPITRALRPRLPALANAVESGCRQLRERARALVTLHRPAPLPAAAGTAPIAGAFHRRGGAQTAHNTAAPAEFAITLKARMTAIHQKLRVEAPELLPPFAEYRALQKRLLVESAAGEPARSAALRQLEGGLLRLEAETGKLSVVLPDATKEYALGSYADALERLSGEAMDCLCGIRAAARPAGGSETGETGEIRPV